jgi:outer membrane lipoprotein-sorting protein
MVVVVLLSILLLVSCGQSGAQTPLATPTIEEQLAQAKMQLKDAQDKLATGQEQSLLAAIQTNFLQQYPNNKIEQIAKPQDVRIIVSTDSEYRHFYRWTDGIIEEIARVPVAKSSTTPVPVTPTPTTKP